MAYISVLFQTQINPTKPIIFYHIPKCAGTTFSVVFSYLLKNIWRIPGSLSGERGNSVAYDYFLKHKEKILKRGYTGKDDIILKECLDLIFINKL